MLKCENYQMFEGTMKISPKCSEVSSFEIKGTWLYKPEYDCWYCKGSSYPASIGEILEDNAGEIKLGLE